jgi:hypothetical protein
MASKTLLDSKDSRYCEGCRRDTGTTVCGFCLQCSRHVIADRRRFNSRSEGNVFFRKTFGRKFKNYFDSHGKDLKLAGSHRHEIKVSQEVKV